MSCFNRIVIELQLNCIVYTMSYNSCNSCNFFDNTQHKNIVSCKWTLQFKNWIARPIVEHLFFLIVIVQCKKYILHKNMFFYVYEKWIKKTRSLGLSVFATNVTLWISHMPMVGMTKMKCIKNGLVFLQMCSKKCNVCAICGIVKLKKYSCICIYTF